MTKSRIDRVLEMEQSLRAADLLTKNSAIASAKKLEEKRIAAEHEVAQLENDAESRGLVSISRHFRKYLDKLLRKVQT